MSAGSAIPQSDVSRGIRSPNKPPEYRCFSALSNPYAVSHAYARRSSPTHASNSRFRVCVSSLATTKGVPRSLASSHCGCATPLSVAAQGLHLPATRATLGLMTHLIALAIFLGPGSSAARVPSFVTQDQPAAPVAKPVRQIAILPWTFREGTETAMKTAKETLTNLFEKSNFEVVPPVRAKTIWEEQLKMPPIKEEVTGKDSYPDLPTPESLLKLGKEMGVQFVCAGRATWHTKSVWVGLGPKTKADCTVDTIVIDVSKAEVVLDAKSIKADSTRKEAGLETAGALLVSFGITALSGGPKTPHQQRSAVLAISDALKPFLTSVAPQNRKIGGG